MAGPWWVSKSTIYKCDACKLGDLIKKVYGVMFNIPYTIMEDQREYEIEIFPHEMDSATKAEFQILGEEMSNVRDHFEAILDDLCFNGHLEAGDYLIKFDD